MTSTTLTPLPAPGLAVQLYKTGVHPRLLIGPTELDALRQDMRSGWPKRIMTALRTKVAGLVDVVEQTDDLPGLLTHHAVRTDPMGGHLFEGAGDMALVAALDRDDQTRDAIRRVLNAIPEAEARGPIDTYCAGHATWGTLQMAYDLSFNDLAASERTQFAQWAATCSVKRSLAYHSRAEYMKSAGANTPMVGIISALLSLLAIEGDDGVGDLADEKLQLLERFEASLFAVMGRNGYPHEDVGYGSGMLSILARVVEATRRSGDYDAFTQCPRYLLFGQAMLHFIQPWGKFLSNTGDYGADFGWRSLIFPQLAAVTDDPALLWLHGTISYPIASSGPGDIKHRQIGFPEIELAKGFQTPIDVYAMITSGMLQKSAHPSKTNPPTQYYDPDRGIVTFRSSWRPDATFIVFDGAGRSPAAQGHNHASGGHFSLSAMGEYFAIDTGRYNIQQDQHNVVLVDGKPGWSNNGDWISTPQHAVLTDYQTGEFVDAASADYSQMSDSYWSMRHLHLVKGKQAPAYAWIVDDVNYANDFREFWWTLNMHPDHHIKLNRDHATITGCDHGNLLDVHFAIPAADEYPKPHTLKLVKDIKLAGSEAYLSDRKKLAKDYRKTVGNLAWGPVFERPRLIAKFAGYNGRFMSLMIPRLKDATPPKVERLPSVPVSLAVRITFDDVYDTIIWAYEHNLLEAGGISARGQWCVVRQSRKTGRVLHQHVHGDGQLKVTR